MQFEISKVLSDGRYRLGNLLRYGNFNLDDTTVFLY